MTDFHGTRFEKGVVVSGHGLASREAVSVFRNGGNAVDAAVAAAFVLTVVCPYATSLAGDVYMLIYDARSGKVHGLNGTGAAPGRATPNAFGDDIPASGIKSVSIPGFVAGVSDALARFGTSSLAELMAPAIDLASDGFPHHATLTRNIANRKELLAGNAAAAELFLRDGEVFHQAELSETLEKIAAEGAPAFYRGEIAAQIVAESQRLGGLLSIEDFARHKSLWQDPVSAPFYGHEVMTMPPNSYGLTLLFQLLALEAGDIASVDPTGAEFAVRGIAARRAAYREAIGLIGDPAELESRARERLDRAIGGELAMQNHTPAPEARDTDTTNVVTIDAEGNAVSLIQSISAPFGAGIVARGTGIILNNRMRGFVTDPDSPNCVAPGKRPAHTLSPCLVMRNGRPVMSVGTPGAAGQTCTIAQFLARTLACGQSIPDAIGAPRWSVDLRGAPIVEQSMEHEIPDFRPMKRGWQTFGSLKVAAVDGDGIVGFADDRREAATAGT